LVDLGKSKALTEPLVINTDKAAVTKGA
jgi:hypothetical protein